MKRFVRTGLSYIIAHIAGLPLNRGLIFQIVIGPKDENWPKESSMKNNGSPARANIRV